MLKDRFNEMILVQLYTDGGPNHRENQEYEIERFGKLVNVQEIEQIASIDSIAWREKNYFYVDESTGRVLQSSQKLHPRLARVSIDFFYKF